MKWWFCSIAGIGECLLQTDKDLMNVFDDGEWFEAHKITLFIASPNGQIGFSRHLSTNPNIANGTALVRRSSVILCSEARDNVVKDMENVWSDQPRKGIALPSADDVLRFKKP